MLVSASDRGVARLLMLVSASDREVVRLLILVSASDRGVSRKPVCHHSVSSSGDSGSRDSGSGGCHWSASLPLESRRQSKSHVSEVSCELSCELSSVPNSHVSELWSGVTRRQARYGLYKDQ